MFTVKAAKPFIADDMLYFDGAGARRVYISKKYGLVIVRLGDTDVSWDDSWLPECRRRRSGRLSFEFIEPPPAPAKNTTTWSP